MSVAYASANDRVSFRISLARSDLSSRSSSFRRVNACATSCVRADAHSTAVAAADSIAPIAAARNSHTTLDTSTTTHASCGRTTPATAGPSKVSAAVGDVEVGCWAAFKKLLGKIMGLLTPSYEYSKASTDILGDVNRQCGYEPDDESWRTARKKIHECELLPAARKRVLRDLRTMRKEIREVRSELCSCEMIALADCSKFESDEP